MANKKDFATALIATAPSPATTGTSIVLESGKGARMPAVPFKAVVHPEGQLPTLDNAERVLVTAIATDTLTITRAQGNTTAKSIASGWRLSNAIFADDTIETQYSSSETDTGKKWIDGRTIYQKTVTGVFNVIASNTISIAHGISGLTTNFIVTSVGGIIKLGANGLSGSQTQTLWFREAGGNWISLTHVDQTNINFASSFAWGNTGYAIILEYVK